MLPNTCVESLLSGAEIESAAIPYLEEALALAFPCNIPKEGRLLMIFHAYLDDSGTHEGSGTVALAGYLSTASRWLQFESEWRNALSDFGIDMFRMSKFANRVDVFEDWTEDERRHRLQRLIEIINRNAGMSVGVGIRKQLFDSIFSEKAKAYAGGAYGVAFACILIELANEIPKVHPEAQVAYVLESGTPGAGEVLRIFQENMKSRSYAKEFRLLSLRFADKRRFLPLQAADIVAYELYKHLPKQPTMPSDARYPLRELSKIPRRWITPDAEGLRNFNLVLEAKASP